jgi:hypothetical protein
VDPEAVASVIRITGGNFRLFERLLTQIERILEINNLRLVAKSSRGSGPGELGYLGRRNVFSAGLAETEISQKEAWLAPADFRQIIWKRIWLNSHKGTKTLTGFFATFYAPGSSAFLRLPKLTLV